MAKPKRLMLPALLAAAVTLAAMTKFCALFLGPKASWVPLTGTALRAEVGTAQKEVQTTSESTVSVPDAATSSSGAKASEKQKGAEEVGWASQAQKMADEAGVVYEKGGPDAAKARAQQILCNAAASTLRLADDSPSWAPPAALGTVILVLIVVLSSALSRPSPSPLVKPSVSTAAPIVVQTQQAVVKPSSSNISPADIDKLFTEIDEEQKPKVKPGSSSPAPSQPKSSIQGRLVSATLVEAAGQSASSSSSAQKSELEAARKLADIASAGLRATADGLPALERAFEGAVPAVQSGITWASDFKPENQDAKVQQAQQAAAKGAESVLRFGAKAGSAGLGVAAENLPQAGQALQSGIEAVMPTFQAGVRGTASFARDLASRSADLNQPGASSSQAATAVVGALPSIFGGIATALDVFADVAPSVEKAASYVGSAAVPVAQATLSAASKLVGDVSDAPVPEVHVDPAQLKSAIKSIGVDVDKIQLPDISAKLPKFGKAAPDLSKAAPGLSKVAPDASKAAAAAADAPRTSVAVLLDP
eukprot:TRINITY_DN4918_c0_g1_i1.p1 TRINITY_DN4918_c0_g1~~TRINITY_DN4918_c0_g1_i1.p1  ORF type:complete len:559 (-),score=114.16 TRINITY_DN4918_c0_g1_i1:124-1728(-)